MLWHLSYRSSEEEAIRAMAAFGTISEAVCIFQNEETGDWLAECFLEELPGKDHLSLILSSFELDAANLNQQPLPEKDWLAENRASFQPIEQAGFFIYPSHFNQPLPADKICLQIDASQAFGTGEHATTKACLDALQWLGKTIHPKKILDLGCGTAILAMAAAQLFEAEILASDIDDKSVQLAEENVKVNSLSDQITCLHSDGFASGTLKNQAPFDLIIANILAQPLIEMSNQLKKYVAQSGYIILSGFLTNQRDTLVAAYTPFKVVHEIQIKDWMAVVLAR